MSINIVDDLQVTVQILQCTSGNTLDMPIGNFLNLKIRLKFFQTKECENQWRKNEVCRPFMQRNIRARASLIIVSWLISSLVQKNGSTIYQQMDLFSIPFLSLLSNVIEVRCFEILDHLFKVNDSNTGLLLLVRFKVSNNKNGTT